MLDYVAEFALKIYVVGVTFKVIFCLFQDMNQHLQNNHTETIKKINCRNIMAVMITKLLPVNKISKIRFKLGCTVVIESFASACEDCA
jgi:hypothetical protein